MWKRDISYGETVAVNAKLSYPAILTEKQRTIDMKILFNAREGARVNGLTEAETRQVMDRALSECRIKLADGEARSRPLMCNSLNMSRLNDLQQSAVLKRLTDSGEHVLTDNQYSVLVKPVETNWAREARAVKFASLRPLSLIPKIGSSGFMDRLG